MALYAVCSNSGTGTTIADAVWYGWCDGTAATGLTNFLAGGTGNTLTTASNALLVWQAWTSGSESTAATTIVHHGTTVVVHQPAVYRDTRTAEQVAADQARYAEQVADRNAKQQAAKAKARALLLSMLDVHQRERLQRDQYFEVIARHSKRRYRIRQGTHGNVRLLDDKGREVTRYCGQPNGVPTEDCMLAQKLQIEHDEAAFLRAANATRIA